MTTFLGIITLLANLYGLFAAWATYIHRRDVYSDEVVTAFMHGFGVWLLATIASFGVLLLTGAVLFGSFVLIRELF